MMLFSWLTLTTYIIVTNSYQHTIYNESLRFQRHGLNPNAALMAKNFDIPDFSHHLDEEWTFLEEEPEITLQDLIDKEPGDTYEIVYDLMKRVLGSKSYLTSQFILELITGEENQNMPSFLSKENIQHTHFGPMHYI